MFTSQGYIRLAGILNSVKMLPYISAFLYVTCVCHLYYPLSPCPLPGEFVCTFHLPASLAVLLHQLFLLAPHLLQIRDYTTFVSQYRAACHQLAEEHRHSTTIAATAAAPIGRFVPLALPLPLPATDYYTTDSSGRVSYRQIIPDVPGSPAMGAISGLRTASPQPLSVL